MFILMVGKRDQLPLLLLLSLGQQLYLLELLLQLVVQLLVMGELIRDHLPPPLLLRAMALKLVALDLGDATYAPAMGSATLFFFCYWIHIKACAWLS